MIKINKFVKKKVAKETNTYTTFLFCDYECKYLLSFDIFGIKMCFYNECQFLLFYQLPGGRVSCHCPG